MKFTPGILFLATAAAFTAAAQSYAPGSPCPASANPGDHACVAEGGPGFVLICSSCRTWVRTFNCPGQCYSTGDGSAGCRFSGWNDPCPDYAGGRATNWCERDGGPSGIRVCSADRKSFPVLSQCDGVCFSNSGHAVCYPEGYNDDCPAHVNIGQRWCDREGVPSKVRLCNESRKFVVEYKCTGVCDSGFGAARCYHSEV